MFNRSDATHEEIASAGASFLLDLYGYDIDGTLEEARYRQYMRTVATQAVTSTFDLSTLPPTSSAARQHSYRVYHQVQQWNGVNLPPTDWGWILIDGSHKPILNENDPAPENILHIISCDCKSGCERNCECRRSGLNCSTMCGYCVGYGCENRSQILDEDDDTEEFEP